MFDRIMTWMYNNIGMLIIIYLAIVFSFIIIDTKYINDKTDYYIEEIHEIDSIKQDNYKLVLEINNLDSIKNVKTIEVKTLNNDSTLKLFYELIRE